MIYKIDETLEIENPTVLVKNVSDDIINKTCTVAVLLSTDSVKKLLYLYDFTYTDTWEDADIIAWVDNKLKDYEI